MKKILPFLNFYQNINIARFFGMKAIALVFVLGFSSKIVADKPTCPKTPPGATKLITNGDFESGDVGFTRGTGFGTAASPCNMTLGGDRYAICTNPNPLNSQYFKPMGDHTTGTGNMFVVDFADTPNPNPVLTYPNIPVTANVSYFFSAWFANIAINNADPNPCPVCPGGVKIKSSPILKFQIERSSNSQILYTETINVDSVTNNWNEFATDFAATFTGDITIKIFNLRQGNGSNDLALDDISFKLGCDGIRDLSKVGKTSQLQETVFTCNEKFKYTLDTKLDNSKYAFNWYEDTNPTTPIKTGISLATPNSSVGPGPTYDIITAPTNNKKFYVCYDSLGDGVTCARLDSVIFKSQFDVNLGPNQDLCPPIAYTINPAITSDQVTYEWFKNPSTLVGSGSAYTAIEPGTYRLKATHALAPDCFSPDKTITITQKSPAFTGEITRPCLADGTRVAGDAVLKPSTTAPTSVTKINGTVSVAWYKDNTTTTHVVEVLNSADGIATIPTNKLDTTKASCPQGGLYLEDKNSFQASLMPSPCPSANVASGPNKYVVKFTSDVPFSLSSMDIFPKWDNSAGVSVSYQMKVYNGTTNLSDIRRENPPYLTPDYQGPAEAFYGKDSENGNRKVTLNGPSNIPAGTYYLQVFGFETANPTQKKEFFASNCNTTNAFSDSKGVFDIDNVYFEGTGQGKTVPGFLNNLKIQVGNANSCGRVWVCATCATVTPVTYTYFNVFPTDGNEVLITWGTANETKNKKFVIEASADGVNFKAVGEKLGANTQYQRDYSFVHVLESAGKQYYRIKQVDHDGSFSYTPVKFVSLHASDAVVSAYPQPVKQGETLQVEVNGLSGAVLAFKLSDISGAQVSVGTLEISEGENAFGISTASLKSGVYLLTLNNEDLVKTIRVVVE